MEANDYEGNVENKKGRTILTLPLISDKLIDLR